MDITQRLTEFAADIPTIEFGRGDFLMKAMSKTMGKTQMPMEQTKALVGAMRGNSQQFTAGLAQAGRMDMAGSKGMQLTRDSMAQQFRAARASGALKPQYKPFSDGGAGRAAATMRADSALADRQAMIASTGKGFNDGGRGRAAATAVADSASKDRQLMLRQVPGAGFKQGTDLASGSRQGLIDSVGSLKEKMAGLRGALGQVMGRESTRYAY